MCGCVHKQIDVLPTIRNIALLLLAQFKGHACIPYVGTIADSPNLDAIVMFVVLLYYSVLV